MNPEDRQDKQRLLEEFKKFLGTRVYVSYVKTLEAEIAQLTSSFIERPPLSHDAYLDHCGQVYALRIKVAFFEDTVSTLEGEIENLLELENPNGTQVETQNDN